MTRQELHERLECHKKWLNEEEGGERLCLRGADLRGIDLRWADLRWADLREADLQGADLRGADLRGADLQGAKNVPNGVYPLVCPSFGAFVGWKKASGCIVKLEIAEDAKRSSATGRKCRCDKARVLEIQNIDGSSSGQKRVVSNYNEDFVYEVGETLQVDDFDDNRWDECAPGIHFFITREEAVEYFG